MNHAELLEYKKQQNKETKIAKSSKPKQVIDVKKKLKEIKEKPEVNKEVLADKAETSELPTNFMQLKSLAKEKGMEVTNTTKKEDIIKFLTI